MQRSLKFVASHMLIPALVAACVFAVGHAVSASADAPPSTIYACVNNSSGTIKIVGAGTTCKNHETLLTWGSGGSGGGGLNGVEVVTVQGPVINSEVTNRDRQTATCPAGKLAISGGFQVFRADNSIATGDPMTASFPVGNPPTAWTTGVILLDDDIASLTVYAVCANATP